MKSSLRPVVLNIAILLAALFLSVGIGSVRLGFDDVLGVISGKAIEPARTILLTLRLPRALLMLLCGAALSGSGVAYQGLFRNPLADPYLIGAASGGGLGAVIVFSYGAPSGWMSYMAVPLSAFAGALLTVAVVYRISSSTGSAPSSILILAGVAISSFVTALTSFLLINASGDLRRAVVWLVGGSTMAGWKPFWAALPYVVIGLAGLLRLAYPLNLLQLGDEQAAQLGLRVETTRRWTVVAATVATAAAVAFAGVIGFVGLLVPHITRRLWGADHRRLLPLAMLAGASFLLVADVIARAVMAPQELPVGIITALSGAPFFLYILRRTRQGVE